MPEPLDVAREGSIRILAEANRKLAEFNRPGGSSARQVDPVLGPLRREAAAVIGGAVSDYLFGSRRPGKQIARQIVDQGRRQRALDSRSRALAEARSLADQLDLLVGQSLLEPIDSRFQSSLRSRLRIARSAARAETVLRRVADVCLQIQAYSPPGDDITLVRRLDLGLRNCIRSRLSALDAGWWTTRVPGPVRSRAETAMRNRAIPGIEPWQFLMFSDYSRIILEKANWTESFGVLFQDEVATKSDLGRLTILRNDVAHSRPLTTADRLEFRRLSERILARVG